MTRPNKNPLFPACLAADGKQGADAEAQGLCGPQDSAEAMETHYQARMAAETAREHRGVLMATADAPLARMVDAANLLHPATIHLADFAPPIKEADGGEA